MPNLGPDKPDAVHVIVPVKDGENNINLKRKKKRKNEVTEDLFLEKMLWKNKEKSKLSNIRDLNYLCDAENTWIRCGPQFIHRYLAKSLDKINYSLTV